MHVGRRSVKLGGVDASIGNVPAPRDGVRKDYEYSAAGDANSERFNAPVWRTTQEARGLQDALGEALGVVRR